MIEKLKGAVEIVGAGHSLQNYIPRCENVWVMNSMNFVVKGATLGFMMDDMRGLNSDPDLIGYVGMVGGAELPVFTSKVYPEFSFMLEYPLRRVIKALLEKHGKRINIKDFLYCTSSLIYLLWYAMYQNIQVIHLHGCDFIADAAQPHRVQERFCAEYWVGVLRGLGYKVLINPVSTLTNRCFIELDPEQYKMYGYEIAPKLEDWL